MLYGIDSNTSVFPTGAPTRDFYIGKMGSGTTASSTYFNATGANLATKRYGYWWLLGPAGDPKYIQNANLYTADDATVWGATQAAAAIQARSQFPLTNTGIIFGDIETGSGKWVNPTAIALSGPQNSTPLNELVIRSFMNQLKSSGLTTGLYTSPGEWQAIMGTSARPSTYASCIWVAQYPSGSAFNTPPSTFNPTLINGDTVRTIWQYYGGTQDANIAQSAF